MDARARRRARGLGNRGAGRQPRGRAGGGTHPARRAVGRVARAPSALQEPVRRRRDPTPRRAADRGASSRPPRHSPTSGGTPVTLHLHNTLTRSVDRFEPLVPGRVSLYTCGPTVYNYAHIGNFRTFLFEDLLRRWLEASGYEVFHVMNLTDVDDKTIRGAAAAGMPLRQHAKQYIDAFFADRDYLRIRPAHAYPRATEYIDPMIALTEGLLRKGVAYRGDDGSVYFAI